jgi:hypothetical protein
MLATAAKRPVELPLHGTRPPGVVPDADALLGGPPVPICPIRTPPAVDPSPRGHARRVPNRREAEAVRPRAITSAATQNEKRALAQSPQAQLAAGARRSGDDSEPPTTWRLLSVIARTAQQALVPIDSRSRAIVSAGDTALLPTVEGAARWPNRRRLLFHERDHPAADHGVIALDAEQSCGPAGRRDRFARTAIAPRRPAGRFLSSSARPQARYCFGDKGVVSASTGERALSHDCDSAAALAQLACGDRVASSLTPIRPLLQ